MVIGIDIDDTTLISEKVGLILDEIDPIDKEYYLEVSSVGLERELRNIDEIKAYKTDLESLIREYHAQLEVLEVKSKTL